MHLRLPYNASFTQYSTHDAKIKVMLHVINHTSHGIDLLIQVHHMLLKMRYQMITFAESELRP